MSPDVLPKTRFKDHLFVVKLALNFVTQNEEFRKITTRHPLHTHAAGRTNDFKERFSAV
jgi:uncharacterized membrane protein YkvA (DUF1232 family)